MMMTTERGDKWQCLHCGEEFEYPQGTRPPICPNPNCGKRHFKALTGPFTYFDNHKFVPKLLADKITGARRFVTHRQSHVIWVYTNGVYESCGEEIIRGECRSELGHLAKEGYVQEVVKHIQETTFTEPEKFEPPTHLINVKNGILDTETGELTPHNPDIIFTNKLPAEYTPSATCPAIDKFLAEVLNHEDVELVQEIVGYCLYRDYPLAKATMLLGEGSNGKSTLLRLIAALLGEKNVATPSLQDIIYNRFAKATLFGKLANIHADIPSVRLKHTGAFKMLTGQDLVWAEEKHKDAFAFRNYAKLLYSANELPQTDDMSEAFWRRWIVINFPNTFPDGAPTTDPNIFDKLTTPQELSGFLNWALDGLKRVLEKGDFTMTKTREQIEDEWVARTDSFRAFVMKHVSTDPNCWVSKDDLYQAYQDFCDKYELPPIEKTMVGRRLPVLITKTTEFLPKFEDKQVRAWKGVRLSDSYVSKNHITDITEKLHIFSNILLSKLQKTSVLQKDMGKTCNICNIPPILTISDIQAKLWDTFGCNPFKPSEYACLFKDDELPKVAGVIEEMLKRGDIMVVPYGDEGQMCFQLVRGGAKR